MEEIKVLIDAEKINERIKELAEEIMKDYQDEEILILCILNGAMYFATDLTKCIKNKVKIDFMKVSSYGNEKQTSGNVQIIQDLQSDLKDKNVLIVEDIIDSGVTMKFLKEYLKFKKAKNIKVAALLNKPERRQVQVDVDYIGFDVPNKFIVGYGLDVEGYYRNLPYVGYIE